MPFAVSKFEVTFDEWDACFELGGCLVNAADQPSHAALPGPWGRGKRPVINVSWGDAQEYVAWLSKETGKSYRLLTEAEWEYAARAGSTTNYSWGDDIRKEGKVMANCNGCGSEWDNQKTAPVGSFAANAFGLHDMHGNVWELVEDCWSENYDGAPVDGSARTTCNNMAGVSPAAVLLASLRGASVRRPASGYSPAAGAIPPVSVSRGRLRLKYLLLDDAHGHNLSDTTFETCRRTLKCSAYPGRSEVVT